MSKTHWYFKGNNWHLSNEDKTECIGCNIPLEKADTMPFYPAGALPCYNSVNFLNKMYNGFHPSSSSSLVEGRYGSKL